MALDAFDGSLELALQYYDVADITEFAPKLEQLSASIVSLSRDLKFASTSASQIAP